MNDKLVIKGARENNLKNIDLTIPRDKLVVFTGISGSGKSTLAFETIYAEGQRRYVESSALRSQHRLSRAKKGTGFGGKTSRRREYAQCLVCQHSYECLYPSKIQRVTGILLSQPFYVCHVGGKYSDYDRGAASKGKRPQDQTGGFQNFSFGSPALSRCVSRVRLPLQP